MPEKIRILLVDDQNLMREGLKTILELEPDFDIAGEADTGLTAIQAYEKINPDVVLMDIRMPDMDGVEATQEILHRWSDARIIILTTFDDDSFVFDGLRAGALGYLLKDVSGEELSEAIRIVSEGGALIEPSIARKVLAEFTRGSRETKINHNDTAELLSNRELQILKLLAQGLTNRQIASNLFLAEGTVKNYVSTIFSKIDVNDRTQAALKAKDLGLL
jgi:DNA-binding NarL/FixJ family response regulator